MPVAQSSGEIPPILYGTAWKEEATRDCVEQALAAGFRGIDTANQPRHYNEAGVGEALQGAFEAGWLTREEVFLQTKFTPPDGQDRRIPYDPSAAPEEQVRQSFARSLGHLGTEWLDSLLLHGPTQLRGLGPADWAIWRALEEIHRQGGASHIGISNVDSDQLAELCDEAEIPPAFVQNRTFLRPDADRAVRTLCDERGIRYQGFSLLAILSRIEADPVLMELAQRRGWSSAQLVFRLCLDRAILPLTGTTDRRHMEQDLAVLADPLSEAELGELQGRLP